MKNHKVKVMVSLFSFALLFSPQLGSAHSYPDVASNDVDFSSINHLSNLSIMTGSEDGQFHPDLPLTRCELLKISLLANRQRPTGQYLPLTGNNGEPTGGKSQSGFSDIRNGDWCDTYANEMKYHRVISGYPDGTFRPNQKVTQIEALKIIVNSLNTGVLPTTITTAARYSDVNNSDWWSPYIQYVLDNSLTRGHDSVTYGISNFMSRREAARVIYNILQGYHYGPQ